MTQAVIGHSLPIGSDGRYRSEVLRGLWPDVDWLWQDPLPSVLSALREWGVV